MTIPVELLRHSFWAKGEALEDVRALAQEAARGFEHDEQAAEFVALLNKAAALAPAERK